MEIVPPHQSERNELLKIIEKTIPADSANKGPQGSFHASRSNPCIYKVPQILRDLKQSAYTPRSISIGPLHHGDDRLKDMSNHKVTYMHQLFSRNMKSTNETNEVVAPHTMEVCVDAMLEDAEKARSCYAESLQSYSNVQFAEMMLVDGCFIVELLYRLHLKNDSLALPIDDPIFGNDLVLKCVRHDLLLLENQIPFFVLEKLFNLALKPVLQNPAPTLIGLVHKFFETSMITLQRVDNLNKDSTVVDHILDLFHKFYKPSGIADKRKFTDIIKYSATELDRAGIKFKVSETGSLEFKFFTSCCFSWLATRKKFSSLTLPCSTRDTKSTSTSSCCFFSWFCQLCGTVTFKIPKLIVLESTETLLRNFIAFEQCSPSIQHHVTSYAYLMDTLINVNKDVEFLEREGVLKNHLGLHKEARDLFNNICNKVALENFFFYNQWGKVEKYYNRPRNLAYLRRTYFSNPWSGISAFAAFVLFILSVIQTIYTVHRF